MTSVNFDPKNNKLAIDISKIDDVQHALKLLRVELTSYNKKPGQITNIEITSQVGDTMLVFLQQASDQKLLDLPKITTLTISANKFGFNGGEISRIADALPNTQELAIKNTDFTFFPSLITEINAFKKASTIKLQSCKFMLDKYQDIFTTIGNMQAVVDFSVKNSTLLCKQWPINCPATDAELKRQAETVFKAITSMVADNASLSTFVLADTIKSQFTSDFGKIEKCLECRSKNKAFDTTELEKQLESLYDKMQCQTEVAGAQPKSDYYKSFIENLQKDIDDTLEELNEIEHVDASFQLGNFAERLSSHEAAESRYSSIPSSHSTYYSARMALILLAIDPKNPQNTGLDNQERMLRGIKIAMTTAKSTAANADNKTLELINHWLQRTLYQFFHGSAFNNNTILAFPDENPHELRINWETMEKVLTSTRRELTFMKRSMAEAKKAAEEKAKQAATKSSNIATLHGHKKSLSLSAI